MPPSLQDTLDRITQNTRALVQAERLAISEQATAQLFASGIEDRILQPGAPAPAFTLRDALTGKLVRSSDLLALGPVILKFFRGRWCPYCVTELETWRDLHTRVRALGANLIAISPQTPRQNDFTLQQHGLPFPILSDPGAVVAERFRIAYTVPPDLRRYYQSILVNIPFINSGATYATADESSWRLPLPATFVIKPSPDSDTTRKAPDVTAEQIAENTEEHTGIISYAEAHADFRVRPEPTDVMQAVLAAVAAAT